MPHLVLEHSAELAGTHDLDALSKALFDAAAASPVFHNIAAIKTRTIACENVHMGTAPATFAHLTVWMLSGRTIEAKQELAESLLAVMDRHLPTVGALSVDTQDMQTETYAKRTIEDE
ncbi:5-carboxymethyl-2-hydroxymuconate Delta-isomerase [Shimia sp. FJ5]|uniref:5-carboxymethyl-2-hydroxymuconate Delta-isomerase n=1 Tax=Shimia sp. FJ5 TaxID=3079054 RepID=UPI0026235CD4|nr:5-carboxymethyl-2-hydroxymuconate isomerase [Shimia sp. FJ5]MDV4146301.1 5-carboxymethyl-2-hydroxymuconate isomerase [Shimia sp. FJ5]